MLDETGDPDAEDDDGQVRGAPDDDDPADAADDDRRVGGVPNDDDPADADDDDRRVGGAPDEAEIQIHDAPNTGAAFFVQQTCVIN